jgi:hypothetical protein
MGVRVPPYPPLSFAAIFWRTAMSTEILFALLIYAIVFGLAGFFIGLNMQNTEWQQKYNKQKSDYKKLHILYERTYDNYNRYYRLYLDNKIKTSTKTYNDVNWAIVLGLQGIKTPTKYQINLAYRKLAEIRHPDKGGTVPLMAELNIARDKALKAIKV